ncbi:hypothetical protein GWI34_40525, partial [Actinomadura sp. DSM 109109]|nr:hypothetical protein [Actinomadura lepetitiana]
SLSHTKEPGWDGLSHLRGFVERAIAEKADVILDLGDRFSDQTRETDYRDALELAPIFKAFPGPRVHILGNHDVSNLSIADNEEIFGQSMQSRVLDLGETRLIAWQPDVRLEKVVGFPKAEPHLQWLIDALNADQRPAIIASHVPVSGHSQIGNYYFERNAHYAT